MAMRIPSTPRIQYACCAAAYPLPGRRGGGGGEVLTGWTVGLGRIYFYDNTISVALIRSYSMEAMLKPDAMNKNDQLITDTVLRERARLRRFIRQQLPDPDAVEDVMQDVFSELVEASRLPEPIEQVGAWLLRVARNRVIDRFRKKREQALPEPANADDEHASFDDLLPSDDAGPEAAYARTVLMAELHDALDELPLEQRAVFVAHELEHRSFKELAAETGVSINTLLARKRYAVLYLRQRLQNIYDEFND